MDFSGVKDPLGARAVLETSTGSVHYSRLERLEELGWTVLAELPFCIRVLLEAALRNCDGYQISEADVRNIAAWARGSAGEVEVPFKPARVILQDFTGVPALVDLAAMRSALQRQGGDPSRVNPLVPVDLVIDHSIQVDFYGSREALERNIALEMSRNRERYVFLRWGQKAFNGLRVIPPGVGIIHQVNLEYLAKVVLVGGVSGEQIAYPDTLVGTDSHTTMINGLGIVGWGVGGIEAEAAMLGQVLPLLLPEVVGLELTGALPPGATSTDLVLTVTALLRREGVVGKFVEFFGPGVQKMSVPDRATLANMAPEYGATMGYFPIDQETLTYLHQTGRSEAEVELVERYAKAQRLFYTPSSPVPKYTKVLTLELSGIESSVAGPKRPQDRVSLIRVPQVFEQALHAPTAERGYAVPREAARCEVPIRLNGREEMLSHGSVVIAAITSCTNTSNPSVMLAAGLLARKAVQLGLRVKPFVKTSLAPGSRVVTHYLLESGLQDALDQLGFSTVGYGCTTCIGNSGPLPEPVARAITENNLVTVAVLSGNRNFEGRVHPLVKANYLASPPLVVAYALAGRIDIHFQTEPLGYDADGKPVFLRDIWPGQEEVNRLVSRLIRPEHFRNSYEQALPGRPEWNELPAPESPIFPWDPESTYIQEPPFFEGVGREVPPLEAIRGARILVLLGDSVTTDHISPAGSIPKSSPAGCYLIERGVPPEEFNSYGARRGNDRVMTRGTFANIRLRNLLVPGTEGGVTKHFPSGEIMTIFEAAMRYQTERVPLLVIAGAEYGSGSSRDWAAKGTKLLGVRAVLAVSFERIHRSNLVGMGVLPLEFVDGASWESLGIQGNEVFEILGLPGDNFEPRCLLEVVARDPAGAEKRFRVRVRIDTPLEMEYYRHGGVLPAVLRKLMD